MSQAVPVIFAPLGERMRLRGRDRAFAAFIAGLCLVVLAIAAYLEPDPAGVGTTMRLGIAPCGFLRQFEIPCAACGMTTSFNHFVRGDVVRSFWAQPLGLVLAIATCTVFWGSAYIAATGRPAHRLLRRLPGVKLILAGVGLGIAAWGFKIAITLLGMADTQW